MTMKQRAHTLWEKAEALTTYVRGMGYDIDTAEHEAYTETLRHVADHGLDKTTRTFQQWRDNNPPEEDNALTAAYATGHHKAVEELTRKDRTNG